ncbi:hypothetical protein Cni_G28712 [Canna indica]|uniref:Uncharacterized protein n=1 Tax=Canna indica TaxID=4628 RepID=A0AAQ3L4F8_9LILI|nr:hypothetical protein Cni_G28712 [Canna indica]
MLEGAVLLTAGCDTKYSDANHENGVSAYHNKCTELALKHKGDRNNQLNTIMLGNEAVHEESYDPAEVIEKRSENIVPTISEAKYSTNGEHDDRESARTLDIAIPEKAGIVQANTELFADKTVTQLKLNEVEICLEVSDCQVVKDICIDDGLHSCEKNLLENTKVSENMTYGFTTSATNVNDELSEHMADDAVLVEEELKLTSVFANDANNQKSSEGLFKNEENLDGSDKIKSNAFGKKTTLQELFSLEELDTGAQSMVPDYHKQNGDHKKIEQVTVQGEHSTNFPFGASMICETSMNSENSIGDMSQSNSEKKHFSARNMPVDATFSNQNGDCTETYPNDQLEGICTSNFKPGTVVTKSGTEENGANTNNLQLANTHYHSASEEITRTVAITTDESSLYHDNHGDLNFPGPYLSGPKVTSGHIAYSGSISLRSDSSTTSTHSFAFPILQREWNTSPVKMAKADRRHSRKSWSLICCRF